MFWPGTNHFVRRSGFTLIELVIVVAIIALLAAIAIPNFLEAQTRAKVSRAKADLRTIAIGLELYVTDFGVYPPNDGAFAYAVTPIYITTPVAYVSDRPQDPFARYVKVPGFPEDARYYSYHRIVSPDEADPVLDPPDAIDGVNIRALERYGAWNQASIGPDLLYADGNDDPTLSSPPYSFDVPYDATNGTVSFGNIIMTQKEGLNFTGYE
jgi:type II secretion system protein G